MLDRGMRIPAGSGRSLVLSLLLALAVARVPAEPSGVRDEVLAAVRGMGTRGENTPGERALFDFLEAEIRKKGLKTALVPIVDHVEGHSFSGILEARIPGTGPGTLALGIQVSDSQPWGDGAEGIAAALELMDLFIRSPPPLELRFAFLGADEDLTGSRAYAAYCADEPSLAAVRVEVPDARSGSAEILIGGTGSLSPYWLLNAATRAARGLGIRDVVQANRSMIQRLGLVDEPTSLDPWFQRGLPAVTLRAGAAEIPDPGPGSAGIVQILENLVRSLESGIPDRWDRQYVLFEAFGLRIAVRETLYVASILALYAGLGLVFVFDSLRNRDFLVEELSRIPRGAAALAMVSAALLVCVLASGALQGLVLRASGSGEYWKVRPVAFSVLRLAQILTLFTALASLGARLGLLPRKAEFFRGSAVVILGADVLLVSTVRLSLSLLFLWAFVIALAGRRASRALRSSWPAALSLPLMFLPLGLLLADLVRDPELEVFSKFLLPGAPGTAWIVFLALPFLMVFVGLGEGLFGKGFYKAGTSSISAVLFLAVSLAGGTWLVSDARGYSGTTEISIREYSDETGLAGRFRIESPRPIPAFRLSGGDLQAEFSGGRPGEISVPLWSGSRIRMSLDRSAFLDRVQLSLSIKTEGAPRGIRISIPSMDSGSVYDTSFPFHPTEDGRGIVIFIGARPPNPVVVSLTVSRDFSALAEIAAVFPTPASPLILEGPVRLRDYAQESRLYAYLRSDGGPVR